MSRRPAALPRTAPISRDFAPAQADCLAKNVRTGTKPVSPRVIGDNDDVGTAGFDESSQGRARTDERKLVTRYFFADRRPAVQRRHQTVAEFSS
jgi:hypothetical protein